MKKFVALLLALVLVFSMSVPSFASDVVYVSNWPSYFTGFYDGDIYSALSDLLDVAEDIENYVLSLDTNITLIRADILEIYALLLEHFNAQLVQMQIELAHWQSVEGSLSSLVGWLVSLNQFLSGELSPLLVSQHTETISSIDSVGAAVSAFRLAFSQYYSQWQYEFTSQTEGTIGYELYMLQQVLADENDLALKKSQEANTEVAFDLFFSESGDNSVDAKDLDGLSTTVGVFQDFFGGDDSNMYDGASVFFGVLSGSPVYGGSPFIWYSEANASWLDMTSLVYSRRSSRPVIVTDYSGERDRIIEDFWGDYNG